MHDTAYELGRKFFSIYIDQEAPSILELGALNVNGSLRDHAQPAWNYIGVDVDPGPGVDIVVVPQRPLPFEAASFDVIASTSAFEHDPFFWQTFVDLVRLLRPGGLIYVNAPSNGAFHRYPRDYWRFYPDAGTALCAWSARCGAEVELVESFIAERADDVWNDFVGVFARCPVGQLPEARLHRAVPCRNIVAAGTVGVLNEITATQDMESVALGREARTRLESAESALRDVAQTLATLNSALAAHLPPPLIEGVVDVLTPERASGWVVARNRVFDRAQVEVLFNEQVVACGPAAQARPDLAVLGLGVDTFAFDFKLAIGEINGGELVVRVSMAGVGLELARRSEAPGQRRLPGLDRSGLASHGADESKAIISMGDHTQCEAIVG